MHHCEHIMSFDYLVRGATLAHLSHGVGQHWFHGRLHSRDDNQTGCIQGQLLLGRLEQFRLPDCRFRMGWPHLAVRIQYQCWRPDHRCESLPHSSCTKAHSQGQEPAEDSQHVPAGYP